MLAEISPFNYVKLKIEKINIFYEEPDPDRWVKFDHYPRKWIRRVLRGKIRPGGVMTIALELLKGFDRLNIPYRFNDYEYAKANPKELIGVIGKPHLISERRFKNPILFGAGVFSHPIEFPNFFTEYPNVKKMLVPGDWMREMCDPFYPNKVESWPIGIDTEKWNERIKNGLPDIDFLIYDKVRWDRPIYEAELIDPIKAELEKYGLSYLTIKYGDYSHNDLIYKLRNVKAVIFLCEHETQGIAYQQILATNTPIFAWDRGGYWQDPHYYPQKVKYAPVSSVPYWNDQCGMKFINFQNFKERLIIFVKCLGENQFAPALYIKDNLTLEICALKYVEIYNSLRKHSLEFHEKVL